MQQYITFKILITIRHYLVYRKKITMIIYSKVSKTLNLKWNLAYGNFHLKNIVISNEEFSILYVICELLNKFVFDETNLTDTLKSNKKFTGLTFIFFSNKSKFMFPL